MADKTDDIIAGTVLGVGGFLLAGFILWSVNQGFAGDLLAWSALAGTVLGSGPVFKIATSPTVFCYFAIVAYGVGAVIQESWWIGFGPCFLIIIIVGVLVVAHSD